MILRILLGVACLSLLNASQAEAQLFRRFRAEPQPQTRYQPQPQRYAPQTVYRQNGYQGQLTAAQRNRPVYLRRADGSVVLYYPNRTQQAATQTRSLPRPQQNPVTARTPNQPYATTEGKLTAVRPNPITRRLNGSVYRQPALQPNLTAAVAPVGVSVQNQLKTPTNIGSISPATPMPLAATTQRDLAATIPLNTQSNGVVPASVDVSVEPTTTTLKLNGPKTNSQTDLASPIPFNTESTNPPASELTLSLSGEVVPASADEAAEPATTTSDSNAPKMFSVLETID